MKMKKKKITTDNACVGMFCLSLLTDVVDIPDS